MFRDMYYRKRFSCCLHFPLRLPWVFSHGYRRVEAQLPQPHGGLQGGKHRGGSLRLSGITAVQHCTRYITTVLVYWYTGTVLYIMSTRMYQYIIYYII